jgi:hypothetical protein
MTAQLQAQVTAPFRIAGAGQIRSLFKAIRDSMLTGIFTFCLRQTYRRNCTLHRKAREFRSEDRK